MYKTDKVRLARVARFTRVSRLAHAFHQAQAFNAVCLVSITSITIFSCIAIVLIPANSYAQLREFDITAMESDRIPVFTDYPDMAAVVVTSSMDNLLFDSNMEVVANLGNANRGEYILIVRPVRQILRVNAPGFMQGRITLGMTQARQVAYYRVEPVEEAEDATIPVIFQVTPADAEVFVYGLGEDGQQVDISQPVPMEEREYRVVFRKTGYRTVEQDVVISPANNFVQQTLEEIEPVVVTIQTNPEASTVVLNGVEAGVSDASGRLGVFRMPGEYELTVRKSGYVTQTQEVTISETGSNQFEVDLVRNVGSLRLQVKPSDAEVRIDREVRTVGGLMELSPGIHRLEVTRDGYAPYSETLDVVRGETISRTIALEGYYGVMQLTTVPFGSQWELKNKDGVVRSGTGLTRVRDLLVGEYVLMVTSEGHIPKEERVEILRDETVSLEVVLEEGSPWPRDEETIVVDVTNPATGVTWMDRNLGASRAAVSSKDSRAYGDLYQWGRAADGHEKRTSSTRTTLSSSDKPSHGDFITTSSSPYDWRSPQNDGLWQGVDGTNNPCPVGYRLPTSAEWNAERQSWSSNNSAGAYGSPLKLPVTGYRVYGDGSLFNVGSFGYYWSSSVDGPSARDLDFLSSSADMYSSSRAYGFSVRCLKE